MSGLLIEEVSFEDYRLVISEDDPDERQRLKLFQGNKPVHLQRRDLQVLAQLLSVETGELLLKSDIAYDVFRTRAAIGNVEHSVRVLRETLKHSPSHKMIRTVRQQGYVFVPHASHVTHIEGNPVLHHIGDADNWNEKEKQEAFDEFFGLSAKNHSGVIVLQCDLIDTVLALDPNRDFARDTSRLFKARSFLNTFDVFGALSIQAAFQKQQRNAPRLLLSDHYVKETSQHLADFTISMGLGFTDQTKKSLQPQVCGSWMGVSRTGGDALSLREDLVVPKKGPRFDSEPDKERPADSEQGRPEFRRLLPSDWGPGYIEAWVRMLPPHNDPAVRDLALIFRNTRIIGRRKLDWVVAGYTERGTAVGGRYLAEYWPQLWQRHVRGKPYTGSFGDFLIVIEGPSDPDRFFEWAEIRQFEITPEKLKSMGINCEWAERIPDQVGDDGRNG